MESTVTFFGGIISQISDKLNLGQYGSIAAMILIILLGISLISCVAKFLKKKIGTFLTIILVVVILFTTGLLSLSQFKNFAQAAGMIYKDGLPEATETDGSWIIEFFQENAPGKEEGAGTWVPDANNPDKW